MTDYRQTIKNVVFKACLLDSENRNSFATYVLTDVHEAVDHCYSEEVGNYGLMELLRVLAEASKDNKDLSNAFAMVEDFIEVAHQEKKAIEEMFIEHEARAIEQAKEKACKVAEEYWQTLSPKALMFLEVKENISTSEQLVELILPDYQCNPDEITADLFQYVVENELLYDTEDKESLYN